MDIVKTLQLENLTQEEKNQLFVQFGDSLLKRLMVRVYGALNPNDQKAFDALAASGDVVKVTQFLSEKVPALDQIRDEELKGLIAEMQGFLKEVKK